MFPCCKKPVYFFGINYLIILLLFGVINTGFISPDDVTILARQTSQMLETFYEGTYAGSDLKKYELAITGDGFLRYRKHYQNGRQDYFSFNMRRFADVGYLGTASSGEILFYTQSDDVIVQTFNDRRGDIDSMANVVSLPVKMIEPEDILLIRNNLYLIKNRLVNNTRAVSKSK